MTSTDSGGGPRRAPPPAGWRLLLALMSAISGLNRRFGRLMVWPILGAVLVSAGNATSRKLFDLSSNSFLELQWYLFGLAFLGAAGYVLMVDEHVRIDAVAQHLRPKTRAWLDVGVLLLFVLPLTAVMGGLGFELAFQAWETGEMSANAGGLPRWPAYACVPLGMALLALQALAETVRRLAWLAGHLDAPNLGESDLPPLIERREPGAPP
jgi:TRAP-type mannitol/chloroaromatic compound transport system permease small subunit